ncbi:PepSY domain-containing protein [Tropicibacter sp. Alg240-R139]|uniref:PepSY domain-containing protein n=1 Tax=Tropicibacter sp. Alg240-R139 TaxID=2305991 RepID=UPI0013DEE6D7|nr:PepSY domain-containing protein [Tropicibacter sp. Alg240-R139]
MTTFKTLTLTAAMLAAPALAMANFNLGDTLGTEEAAIRALLEEQGYQVQEIEFEDDEIEVEVLKDGVETKLVLNQADGSVVEIEIEQEDD